jgi:deoxyadenosine/deoxycytidine kinase
MLTTPPRLGTLVKAYRESKGWTQHELARRLTPVTSRSVVAHVEQGLRIPPAAVVSRICTALEIPRPLWEPFVSVGFAATAHRARSPMSDGGMIIALAGVMGSGKTTLAKALADVFGAALLPEPTLGLQYLKDLADNPKRWAYETQLAFLSNKAAQIRQLFDRQRTVIVDRSMSEDVDVFARHWHDSGDIDERSFQTYSALAEHLQATLPAPDLLVVCSCSKEVAFQRVEARARKDRLHTQEHVAAIHARYEQWLQRAHPCPVIVLDSQLRDFRNPIVVQEIAAEIESRVMGHWTGQLDLFGEPRAVQRDVIRPATGAAGVELQPHPVFYLAAPFTGVAEAAQASVEATKTLFDAPHGVIAPGPYRTALLAVERVLEQWGIRTIIPHREVNRWGHRSLEPSAAAEQCTNHVLGCDGTIALLGTSHGAHYEVGLAMGLGRPCILVECEAMGASFIGSGLTHLKRSNVMTVRCQRLSEIAERLSLRDVREFVARHVPIAEMEVR